MATRWIVLAGLIFARIAFAFQLQSVAVIAPGLMDGLALDVLSIGTLVGLFMLPGLFLAIPGAMLGQRFGERRFLAACLAAMTLGGAICGYAEDYHWLWIGRLISGFGAVGLNVVMSKIVIDWFAGKEIATAMALFLVGFPIGIGLALVTLGNLATADAWPAAFLATAGFSLSALVVFVATYRPADAAASSVESVLSPSWGELGMVSLAGMIWAIYNAAYMVTLSFAPLYLISTGMAPAQAASLMGIGVWVSILAVPLGGVISDRFGRPNLIIVAGALIWGLGLLLIIPWSNSLTLLVILFAVTAVTAGLAAGPIVALASEVLRPETRGIGMGIFYTWLYGGLAVGPMIGGIAANLAGDYVAPIYLITGLTVSLVCALGLFRNLQARGLPAAISLSQG